tara:strand:- start:153 stop:689 length:537 start_codon:yes stop_codon:yes gene_type:complete
MINAQSILKELLHCGVTDIVGLPDNCSATLFALLNSKNEPKLRLVSREGEAFALASGLWIGGKKPIILIQNTGLLESGDSFRGTALRMRIPLLCLVTFRGYAKTKKNNENFCKKENDHLYSQPSLDSVALFTEPTLKAWGLPFDFLSREEDTKKISSSIKLSEELGSPVVLLVTENMT